MHYQTGSYRADDLMTAKTCFVCGETEGEALGHSWQKATCQTPKTCSVCGMSPYIRRGKQGNAVLWRRQSVEIRWKIERYSVLSVATNCKDNKISDIICDIRCR